MLGISYHPLYDAYHCIFRLNALLRYSPEIEVDLSRVRMLDFYLVMPSLIQKIRLSGNLKQKLRDKHLHRISEPYQKLPSLRQLFRAIQPIQEVAFRHLLAVEFLDDQAFNKDIFRAGDAVASEDHFLNSVDFFIEDKCEIFEFLVRDLAPLQTFGHNGLKHRSALMEHHYDAV